MWHCRWSSASHRFFRYQAVCDDDYSPEPESTDTVLHQAVSQRPAEIVALLCKHVTGMFVYGVCKILTSFSVATCKVPCIQWFCLVMSLFAGHAYSEMMSVCCSFCVFRVNVHIYIHTHNSFCSCGMHAKARMQTVLEFYPSPYVPQVSSHTGLQQAFLACMWCEKYSQKTCIHTHIIYPYVWCLILQVLYAQDPDKFLLSGRRRKKNRQSTYLISTDEKDLARKR